MMQQLVSQEVPLNKEKNNLAKTTYAIAFPFDRFFLFVCRAIARMRNDRLSFSIRLFIPTPLRRGNVRRIFDLSVLVEDGLRGCLAEIEDRKGGSLG
jgi:hypothetical protein